MTAATSPQPARATLSKIARLALRELRAGVGGFTIFIACIALGVAVIAGVGTLSDALTASFERQGEVLLGGDATLARPHRRAEPDELAWMRQRARVSETATLRSMARRLDGEEQTLVELKGIDDAYPLTGALVLEPQSLDRAAIFAGHGAALDRILLDRLRVAVGDSIELGRLKVVIRAVVENEPDKISDRLTFGPRVFVSAQTLAESGLAEPGSLVRWRYALRFHQASTNDGLKSFRDEVKRDLPDAGFTVADRRDPSPQVSKTLERLRQFLTLIGLTSLMVGGVGVANAVAAYIDRRRKVIATFKSLGASRRQIFLLHLVQVLAIAAIGIVLGLVIGIGLPVVLGGLIGDTLPIKPELRITGATLAMAIAYGLLVTLLFTIWPLGRADEVRATVLFREQVQPSRIRPRWEIIAATVVTAAALLALALLTSESKRIAAYFCLAVAGVFVFFLVLGSGLTWLARRIPKPRRPELALALGSLGAPGGLTRAVVLSLGMGLSLLVAVALTDAAIVSELQSRLPRNSPNFFVLDIPRADMDGISTIVKDVEPRAHVNHAPMLRGRLVALKGLPAEQIKTTPEAQWVLSGDRGLTYADDVPEGSILTKGQWWPKDYAGPPLVSFEGELARLLGLAIGDEVTVNVLGRNITAKVANLREVRWESLAINFVMVFSPNTLRAAPHNLLATIALPATTTLAAEADLARRIGKAYPAITAIRVKDAINAFNAVFTRIMGAVRVAGGVTLLAGALVLAGAMATARRRRIMQAVILKAIGGTRRRILTIHVIEYLILALATALCSLVLGSAAAWVTLRRVIDVPFVFSWSAVGQSLVVATGLVMALGAWGTIRVLAAPPVPYLRSD